MENNLCKELDDARAAIEKLTAENRTKTELCDNLKAAHSDHVIKIKEAKLEIEKQAQQLTATTGELSVVRLMYEDAKSNLQEKESSLRQLRYAHEKLRADNGEKLQVVEGKNRELISALDEANTKIQEQEQKTHRFKEEIERIKDLLSISQKKVSEAEQKAEALKDKKQRDDLLMNLDEENAKIKDQLKWKKEQFKHLQEAHEKVQDQFRLSKKEWEQERSTLIDEISSLQTRLDSQTRISESLQCKLQMCNQALAHEESRRKLLEVQMSESKACYENVFAECEEAKSKIERLSSRRDDEIATLRNLLSTKETLFKEAEYRREYLEQENQELRLSLKGFQEAQIKESGSVSSLTKLRNKLRGLEQLHKECSAKLSARETEWDSQIENLREDLSNCRSKLDHKDIHIQELQLELENCYSSVMQLKLQNDELHVMLTVYKCALLNAHSSFLKQEVELELKLKEAEGKVVFLIEELDKKNNALVAAHAKVGKEQGIKSSASKIELPDPHEQKYLGTLGEVEHHKEMLEESRLQQFRLEEQALETEGAFREELRQVSDAFNKVSSELAEKMQEAIDIELDLERWKSAAENLQHRLDESQKLHKEMEGPHLAQVEKYKEMLEESSLQQFRFEEQAVETEGALREELRQVSDAFNKVSSELTEKMQEAIDIELELERWKSAAEHLQHRLDESQKLRKEMEGSLLAQVEKYKEMLEESSLQQFRFEEQAAETEYVLKEELRQIYDAFDKVSSELAEKVQEESEIDFELDRWKSAAEHLQRCLDENQEFRKEMEGSLLAQVETEQTLKQEKEHLLHLLQEKDKRTDGLQQVILSLKQELSGRKTETATLARMAPEDESGLEKENLLQIVEEKDKNINNLKQKIEWMEQEFMRRELDAMRRELEAAIIVQIKTEKSLEHEKERLYRLIEKKDHIIESLRLEIEEHDLTRSITVSALAELEEKQTHISTLHEASSKFITDQFLAELETQVKNAVIMELEEEITSLQLKLKSEEKSIPCLKHQVEQLEAALETKQSEMETKITRLGSKLRISESSVEKLESENRTLTQYVAELSSQRIDLLALVEESGEQINKFANEDKELMGRLGRMLEGFETEEESVVGLKGGVEFYSSNRENGNSPLSLSVKNNDSTHDRRLPLIERNS